MLSHLTSCCGSAGGFPTLSFCSSAPGHEVQLVAVVTLPVVIPPFHFAANQFMVQVQFCLDPEHTTWCVEGSLAILDMEQTKCEINDVVYPMRMGPNYMLPSALEAMGTYWSAWDEELDENHRVHFAILDIPLFRSMLGHARAAQFRWTCRNSLNPDHRHQTCLEVHLVPSTEIVDLVGRMYTHSRRQQEELHQLQTQLRETH